MATFVEIQTDAFADNVQALAKQKRDNSGIRRPYRGIEIKEDTHAVIKVIRDDGSEIPLTDAGGSKTPQSGNTTKAGSGVAARTQKTALASTYNYSNFIIQRMDESRQEKSQILETFGDSFIFFFGERPRMINVSGLLMNTLDFNWRTEFWYNYEKVLRGTKLVEQNARMYLFWDDLIVEGYMLQAQARDDSESPYHIPFSFTMFVTNHMYLSTIGDENYPITTAVNLQPLLRESNVNKILSATRELKAQGIKAQELISTTEAVRFAAQDAEFSRQASVAAAARGQGFNAAKNLLTNALMLGLNAQNLTFLSVANHYFKNRKMRFPKGIAGAEAMSGPPTVVGDNTMYGFLPQRTMALRSKIRDNVDEYVNGGPVGVVNIDEDAVDEALEAQDFNNGYELELQALEDLADLGLDPVQHPGGGPMERAHNLAVGGAIVASAVLRFGIG